MKTILIDPGHGGRDSGALGPDGEKESDVVLAVSLELRDSLIRRGFDVAMTRSTDTYPSRMDRVAHSNRIAPDLFLSVHANAAGGHGHEVFTSPGNTRSDSIASAIFKAYSAAFPHLPPRADYRDGDPDKEARFTVLTKTRAPAVLYELEFIDTARGVAFLTSPVNQRRMAEALAKGVEDHFGPQHADVKADVDDDPAESFDEKAPRIMRKLMKDLGLNPAQAAGVLGNIGHECDGFKSMQELNPRAGSAGGWGWCQWTGSRRKAFEEWADKLSLDYASDAANYGFLVHEFKTTERRALADVQTAMTIRDATERFMVRFERPGVPHFASRYQWAQRAHKAFGAAEPDDGDDDAAASLEARLVMLETQAAQLARYIEQLDKAVENIDNHINASDDRLSALEDTLNLEVISDGIHY